MVQITGSGTQTGINVEIESGKCKPLLTFRKKYFYQFIETSCMINLLSEQWF